MRHAQVVPLNAARRQSSGTNKQQTCASLFRQTACCASRSLEKKSLSALLPPPVLRRSPFTSDMLQVAIASKMIQHAWSSARLPPCQRSCGVSTPRTTGNCNSAHRHHITVRADRDARDYCPFGPLRPPSLPQDACTFEIRYETCYTSLLK